MATYCFYDITSCQTGSSPFWDMGSIGSNYDNGMTISGFHDDTSCKTGSSLIFGNTGLKLSI